MSPRIKPTTILTGRTKPTTSFTKPRDREEHPVSFDSVEITFDSTLYTWDMTFEDLWPLTTAYNTPRYAKYIKDMSGQFVFDLSWEQVLWITGRPENKIITNYT